MLIGYSSTGKSHALSLVTYALEAIEDFDQLDDLDSNFLDGIVCVLVF